MASRDESPDLATSTSPSPAPSHLESRINLPPNVSSSEAYLDGELPNVLADRALGLHTRAPHLRPEMPARSPSLLSVLSGAFSRSSKGGNQKDIAGASAEERERLLDGQEGVGSDGEEEDGEADGGQQTPDGGVGGVHQQDHYRRSSRSRSKSQRRKLKWHQRPSPLWFLPGTLLMSLSIGMVMSPKVEIFTQLICRALNAGPQDSNSTPPVMAPSAPIPTSTVLRSHHLHSASSYSSSSDNSTNLFVQQSVLKGLEFENWGSEDQESWAKQCRKNPDVQKAVASLALVLALLMGILSSLTTGFWGTLSDRRGRKPILSLALLGMVVMDVVLLIVFNYHNKVGYRFLLLGPAFDGLLGGMSTASAATNAYISDSSEAGSRARLFAVLGGLLFGGIALGPSLGSLVIRLTGTIVGPFYVALVIHIIYLFAVVFVIPESLSHARQVAARHRHQEELAARAAKEVEEVEAAAAKGWIYVAWTHTKRTLMRPWAFLRPLNLLLPKRGPVAEEDLPILRSRGPPRQGWDTELTKLGIGYAFYIIMISVAGVKLQYTQYKFGWGPQENGYYLTFSGITRMLVLIVILPLLIKLVRKPAPTPSSPRPDTPPEHTNGRPTLAQAEWDREAKYLRVVHDSHFDLLLAQLSITIDVLGMIFMALNHGSTFIFVASAGVQSLGGGASPAIQSLALAHASARDSGRLFASLSVLQAIMSQILGPVLFSVIFIRTVGVFPELFFWAAVVLYLVALVALLAVRLGRKIVDGEVLVEAPPASPTAAAASVAAKWQRGRSSTRKPGTLSESGFHVRED
ncbi:MFS general substrate transporter [Meredithblackwellia eburnea MCA 4105]